MLAIMRSLTLCILLGCAAPDPIPATAGVAVVTDLIENSTPARYSDEQGMRTPDGRWVIIGGSRYARPSVLSPGEDAVFHARAFKFLGWKKWDGDPLAGM